MCSGLSDHARTVYDLKNVKTNDTKINRKCMLKVYLLLVTDDCEGKMNEIVQWGLMLVERWYMILFSLCKIAM